MNSSKFNHFKIEINNQKSECVILERKKHTDKKPPFYIFDLTRCCYVSSLKPTAKENQFSFDVRDKENDSNIFYTLSISESGKIEVSKE